MTQNRHGMTHSMEKLPVQPPADDHSQLEPDCSPAADSCHSEDAARMAAQPFASMIKFSSDGRLLMFDCHYEAGSRCVPPARDHVIGVVRERSLEAETWTPSKGRRVDKLVEGDVLIVPAGERFSISSDKPHRVIVLLIRPELLSGVDFVSGPGSAAGRLVVRTGVKDPILRCIADAAASEAHCSTVDASPLLDFASAALVAHLSKHYADSGAASRGALSERQLNMISEYVRSHVEDSIRLEDLASITGYSVCHFSHLFKTTTGRSPMRYVLEYKMRRARELIETTRVPLTQLGLSLGYGDSAHFSRTFKGYWKTPPSAVQRPDV